MLGNIFQPRRSYSASYSGTRSRTTRGASTRRANRSSGRNGVVALTMYLRKPSAGARSEASRCAVTTSSIATRLWRYSFILTLSSGVGLPHIPVIVWFGKKARRAEHDAGKCLVSMEKLAEILRCSLGHAIDILRHRRDLLGHPRGRGAGRRHQGIAEDAGR